jgi:hypothetical protein
MGEFLSLGQDLPPAHPSPFAAALMTTKEFMQEQILGLGV